MRRLQNTAIVLSLLASQMFVSCSGSGPTSNDAQSRSSIGHGKSVEELQEMKAAWRNRFPDTKGLSPEERRKARVAWLAEGEPIDAAINAAFEARYKQSGLPEDSYWRWSPEDERTFRDEQHVACKARIGSLRKIRDFVATRMQPEGIAKIDEIMASYESEFKDLLENFKKRVHFKDHIWVPFEEQRAKFTSAILAIAQDALLDGNVAIATHKRLSGEPLVIGPDARRSLPFADAALTADWLRFLPCEQDALQGEFGWRLQLRGDATKHGTARFISIDGTRVSTQRTMGGRVVTEVYDTNTGTKKLFDCALKEPSDYPQVEKKAVWHHVYKPAFAEAVELSNFNGWAFRDTPGSGPWTLSSAEMKSALEAVDDYLPLPDYLGDLVLARQQGLWGAVNSSGHFLVPPKLATAAAVCGILKDSYDANLWADRVPDQAMHLRLACGSDALSRMIGSDRERGVQELAKAVKLTLEKHGAPAALTHLIWTVGLDKSDAVLEALGWDKPLDPRLLGVAQMESNVYRALFRKDAEAMAIHVRPYFEALDAYYEAGRPLRGETFPTVGRYSCPLGKVPILRFFALRRPFWNNQGVKDFDGLFQLSMKFKDRGPEHFSYRVLGHALCAFEDWSQAPEDYSLAARPNGRLEREFRLQRSQENLRTGLRNSGAADFGEEVDLKSFQAFQPYVSQPEDPPLSRAIPFKSREGKLRFIGSDGKTYTDEEYRGFLMKMFSDFTPASAAYWLRTTSAGAKALNFSDLGNGESRRLIKFLESMREIVDRKASDDIKYSGSEELSRFVRDSSKSDGPTLAFAEHMRAVLGYCCKKADEQERERQLEIAAAKRRDEERVAKSKEDERKRVKAEEERLRKIYGRPPDEPSVAPAAPTPSINQMWLDMKRQAMEDAWSKWSRTGDSRDGDAYRRAAAEFESWRIRTGSPR